MRRVRVLVVLVALSLGAGCGGGDDTGGGRDGEGVVTPSLAPARAPLTGLPADDPAALQHPAVALKVSDVPAAHPQVGVDRADIVFVEPIGVSYTRLAAVFHSDLPDDVGPVRSVRVADAALLGPLAPVFGNTMGAAGVLAHVDAVADLDDLGTLRVRGTGAYTIDGTRPEPDHVIAHPQVLMDLSDRTAPPPPYFGYATDPAGSSAALAGGPGERLEVPYGPAWTVGWQYDEATARYQRDEPFGPHVTTDGVRVGATNVVVLRVEPFSQQVEGGTTPGLRLVDASGRLTALAGGRSVEGTWSKAGVNEPFVLRTETGDDLLLAPGTTWVELPTPDAVVTTG